MTEDQIERKVERMMYHLDRLLLNGDIKQEDYDAAAREIVDLLLPSGKQRMFANRVHWARTY